DAQKQGARETLVLVLEALLRVLHPIMPFITEEIWQQTRERAGIAGDTIMLRPYPTVDEFSADADAEDDIDWVRQFILGVRQIRGEMDISPGKMLPVLLQNTTSNDRDRAQRNIALLNRVGRVESVRALEDSDEAPPAATALLGDMRLLVPMQGLIDVDAERARLGKQRDKVGADLAKAQAKLGNERFVSNAPEAVVEQEKQRVADFERQLGQLAEQLLKLDDLA
ncbi:MAG: class I tRNA ligase family protein, partial [Woeseia sp.]